MSAHTPELFELELTDGHTLRAHQRALGCLEDAYPWTSLDPADYPPRLVQCARLMWTETALAEAKVAAEMGQLLAAFVRARVPVDFWSAACRFALDEVRHVELAARVATRLGGGAPLAFSPSTVGIQLEPSLSARQAASELCVRVLCVSETLSLLLLSGARLRASHPLTRAVLTRIVRDEAPHSGLGWDYLDWLDGDGELPPDERDRLGRAARAAIDEQAPLWEQLKSRVEDGVTSEGFRVADIHQLGWMASSDYRSRACSAVRDEILPRLARHGIRAD